MQGWKDTTSYRQGERLKGAEPSSWTLKGELLSVTVTKGHICYPDEWVLHCPQLTIEARPLRLTSNVSAELAQRAALERVRLTIRGLTEDLALMEATP